MDRSPAENLCRDYAFEVFCGVRVGGWGSGHGERNMVVSGVRYEVETRLTLECEGKIN